MRSEDFSQICRQINSKKNFVPFKKRTDPDICFKVKFWDEAWKNRTADLRHQFDRVKRIMALRGKIALAKFARSDTAGGVALRNIF